MQKTHALLVGLTALAITTSAGRADITVNSGSGIFLYPEPTVANGTYSGTGDVTHALATGNFSSTEDAANSGSTDSVDSYSDVDVSKYSVIGSDLLLSGTAVSDVNATSGTNHSLTASSAAQLGIDFTPSVALVFNVNITGNPSSQTNYDVNGQTLTNTFAFTLHDNTTGSYVPITLDAQGNGTVDLTAGDNYSALANALTDFVTPGGNNLSDPQTFSGAMGINFSISTNAVTPPVTAPEPSTWAMLVAGAGMLGILARVRRMRA